MHIVGKDFIDMNGREVTEGTRLQCVKHGEIRRIGVATFKEYGVFNIGDLKIIVDFDEAGRYDGDITPFLR